MTVRRSPLAWMCAVALVAASSGCAHQSAASRTAAFAGSLPICVDAPDALTVAEARGTSWGPGDRLVVHGHLAIVAWGPPCDGAASHASGAHCARSWTLWDADPHPVELFDQSPADAGALTLTARAPEKGAFTLPALDEGEAPRAGTPALDIEVTVTGEIPAELCEPTNVYPGMQGSRSTKVDCASISLDVAPLTVTGVCRSAGDLPDSAGDNYPIDSYPRCARTVTDAAVGLEAMTSFQVGDAVAIRGVMTPGAEECTQKACIRRDAEHGRERRIACCNDCGGAWLLRDLNDPGAMGEAARKAPVVAVQMPGQDHPLHWSAQDCRVGNLLARAQPEIVVSGVVREWRTTGLGGIPPATPRLIDQARICATGAWSEPRPAPPRPRDGPWFPSGEPLDIEGPRGIR
jgi:hypothetical protein